MNYHSLAVELVRELQFGTIQQREVVIQSGGLYQPRSCERVDEAEVRCHQRHTFLTSLFDSASWKEPAMLCKVMLRPDLFSIDTQTLLASPLTTSTGTQL